MLFRRTICINTHRLIFCQKLPLSTENLPTVDNTEDALDGITKKSKLKTVIEKPKKESYCSNEVQVFLQKKLSMYNDLVPKVLMRRATTESTKLFIIDKKHAKALASMISTELLSDSTHVMDCSPGLGFLTEELLKAGVPFINLYEMNKSFYKPGSPLSMLMDRHPDKLKLYPFNFSKVWKLLLRDEFLETSAVEQYFVDIPYSQWKSDTYMQVIEFSPTRKPISLIMYNFFKQTHLFERGRPCFYIGMPLPAWNNILNLDGRFYSQYSVMFNLFFDVKHLGELPREAFIPWPREKYWNLDNLETPIHIVKVEPKRDVFDILTKDDLNSFWFFLKYCLKTRKNKVLAEFEKFVPGSGIKLIQQDCGILTTFKELSPQKLLEIFKMYQSWPEYDAIMFNPSLSIGEEKKSAEKLEEEDEFLEEFESMDNDDQALSTDDKRENG